MSILLISSAAVTPPPAAAAAAPAAAPAPAAVPVPAPPKEPLPKGESVSSAKKAGRQSGSVNYTAADLDGMSPRNVLFLAYVKPLQIFLSKWQK